MVAYYHSNSSNQWTTLSHKTWELFCYHILCKPIRSCSWGPSQNINYSCVRTISTTNEVHHLYVDPGLGVIRAAFWRLLVGCFIPLQRQTSWKLWVASSQTWTNIVSSAFGMYLAYFFEFSMGVPILHSTSPKITTISASKVLSFSNYFSTSLFMSKHLGVWLLSVWLVRILGTRSIIRFNSVENG